MIASVSSHCSGVRTRRKDHRGEAVVLKYEGGAPCVVLVRIEKHTESDISVVVGGGAEVERG